MSYATIAVEIIGCWLPHSRVGVHGMGLYCDCGVAS